MVNLHDGGRHINLISITRFHVYLIKMVVDDELNEFDIALHHCTNRASMIEKVEKILFGDHLLRI